MRKKANVGEGTFVICVGLEEFIEGMKLDLFLDAFVELFFEEDFELFQNGMNCFL